MADTNGNRLASREDLRNRIARSGFAFVQAQDLRELLSLEDRPHPNPPPHREGGNKRRASVAVSVVGDSGRKNEASELLSSSIPCDSEGGLGWGQSFANSWNDLGLDTYMADGGRYRRRRFAAFAVSPTTIIRKPHQPHYQSRDYNALNGGIERWFEPITDEIAAHPFMLSCLRFCGGLFDELTVNKPETWHVETHQFRIEARSDEHGQPTPEGLHRDGVDWVMVLLIARVNIAAGVTTIHDAKRTHIGEFTLLTPLDAAFVDDHRVYHGVTAVTPIDPNKPAYRDVLVITFRRP